MTELVVQGVEKSLGGLPILQGASFQADKGRILALLGASGSGKTTLLRCIAGLEQPEKGSIEISGKRVFDASTGLALAPEQRQIGLVFQSYALWPHRTVAQNVAYGLKLRNVTGAESDKRVAAILEKLGLALYKSKRYNEAASAFDQLKTYKPDDKTYNYLGESYFEDGKVEQSVDAFNNAVSMNPDFDKARFNLGRAYLKQGNRDMAQVQLEILRNSRSDYADRLYVLLNP